jgi:hypothetical protein
MLRRPARRAFVREFLGDDDTFPGDLPSKEG